jgi:23S rRNA (uridine2552-2'-O)-methyltransferase
VGKRGSSDRWLRRQKRDPYVARSQIDGYRSRAVYKLQQLDTADKLLKRGGVVVDLGSAPGGFSQYAASRVGDTGQVLAVDLLPMDSIPGVEFVQGDFTTDATLALLSAKLTVPPDLVMSDMAPNITGNSAVDQPRSMLLAELALEFAREQLNPGGDLLVKLFQGEGFEAFVSDVRSSFGQVKIRKPAASRSASREMYLLARHLKM